MGSGHQRGMTLPGVDSRPARLIEQGTAFPAGCRARGGSTRGLMKMERGPRTLVRFVLPRRGRRRSWLVVGSEQAFCSMESLGAKAIFLICQDGLSSGRRSRVIRPGYSRASRTKGTRWARARRRLQEMTMAVPVRPTKSMPYGPAGGGGCRGGGRRRALNCTKPMISARTPTAIRMYPTVVRSILER